MLNLNSFIKWWVIGGIVLSTGIYDHADIIRIRANNGLCTGNKAPASDKVKATVTDTLLVDTIAYNLKWQQLVHGKPSGKWPVKASYPLKGSLLPFNRIVAFYGNFFSAGMGILGRLPEDALINKLSAEALNWQKADSLTPVIPAIHYIAITAQRSPGKDHKYRLRMPAVEIEKAIKMATKINGLVFLDVQVGHSTLEEELPSLTKYLLNPIVHLGIDPEYSMKGGEVPCSVIGRFDAADINYAASFLQTLVKSHQLPPKILVVHRFTKGMLTNSRKIHTMPEVQIVINMDGFGFPAKKKDSYNAWVAGEPVQFTGFKIFYKQDTLDKRGKKLMTPNEVLQLYPQPVYIQYQ